MMNFRIVKPDGDCGCGTKSISFNISNPSSGSSSSTGVANWANIIGRPSCFDSCLTVLQYIQANLDYSPGTRIITINGTAQNLTADRSWSVGTVTSVGLTQGTGISVSGGPITGSGNITVTNTAPDQVVSLTPGYGIGVTGTYPNFTVASTLTGDYITQLTGEATAIGPGSVPITLVNSAVIGKVLTGLNITGGSVVATDSILQGFGKLQNQISALLGGVTWIGVWNASTNTPALTSSVGTKGHYYVVDTDGTTNLDGITDWKVGDWAIFNGATWNKVDNTDAVSSVNGYTAAVSLVTGDVLEGAGVLPGRPSNLYYTDARARAAISLTTTGSSGAATYNSTTGVLNVPDYGAGQFWTRAITTLSPATANDKIFASSASGSTFESLNTGIGGLAFYGSSTNGVGAQFQSGSAGDPGLIVKNISGGPIQQWFDHSSTVASVANNGNFTATAFITTGGTASQVVLGNGTLGTLVTSADYIQNQVAGAQTAGFKISGDGTLANLTASTKVNVASPSGTTGDVNTGQAGIYSYRSAGRYVRFNTSGTFNDFLSLGAKLVMNYGFSGTVENISMFEGSAAGDGQFIVGSPTATNARFLLKGKDTGATNYISRWFDSGNTEKFSVRNDGQTTVASLSAGGIVKSTAGVLSIATANTDYAPATGGTGYIQNQYSVIQTASMAISGRAIITDGVIAGGAPGITGVPRFLINQAASGNIQVEFPTSTSTDLVFTTATSSRIITFPDATGTVALTSALSSYLPLSGGTLTGALTGTSATFSGAVSATGSISSTPQGTLYGTASGSITSTQLATSLTDETGTGSAVFNTSPSITTPTFTTSATVGAGTSNINFGATSNYGYASFNGSASLTGMLGMFGGGSGDLTSLYLQAPTGGALDFRIGSTDALQVNASGDLIISGSNATKASGTAWINPSDLRLKMNVGDYSKGLAEVLQIKPKTWYFNKASGFDQTKKHLSPIAQELKLIMPEMVSTYKGKLNGKEQELLQVDASDMTWLLVKAIQEQQVQISGTDKALQEALIRIEELENKLKGLDLNVN